MLKDDKTTNIWYSFMTDDSLMTNVFLATHKSFEGGSFTSKTVWTSVLSSLGKTCKCTLGWNHQGMWHVNTRTQKRRNKECTKLGKL